MTTKEQSLEILDAIARVAVENAALRTVLASHQVDGIPIDWQRDVNAIVQHPEALGVARKRYADIRQAILDHPEGDDHVALLLLSMLAIEI